MGNKIINMCERLLFISFFSLVGCGYFDNDNLIFENKIVGRINFSQQENSSQVNLIFSRDSQHGEVIISSCKRILYDSVNENIYVEEILNEYNSNYYIIKVLDTNTTNSFEAYKEMKIPKSKFDSMIIKHSPTDLSIPTRKTGVLQE